MGMTRGTALVATKVRVVQLTGIQELATLEVTGELTLTDLLTSASDAIFDQLEGEGIDPTALTNEEIYERAVAWHFLATLVIGNYMRVPEGMEPPRNEQGQADPYAWSDPHRKGRPKLSTPDAPHVAGSGVPRLGNITRRPLYGCPSYYDDLPNVR